MRRVVLEVDGNLFVFTNGSGINKFNNTSVAEPATIGSIPVPIPIPFAKEAGVYARREVTAGSNDIFGAQAFRQLDAQMFKHLEELRKRANPSGK